jgi:hypothetical protein
MTHPDEGGIGIRGISNLAAEAATGHLNHSTLSRLVSVADGRKLRSFSCASILTEKATCTSIPPALRRCPATNGRRSFSYWARDIIRMALTDMPLLAAYVRRICDIIRPVVWRCPAE